LGRVVNKWLDIEEESDREDFRSKIQSYVRLYGYISQIISFEDVDLEKLYVFLKYLNKKLPRREQDNFEDITSQVDLDSFRIQETFSGSIKLQNVDGEFEPLGMGESKTPGEDEMDILSKIITRINELHGEKITEEDKIDLENMRKRIVTNEELQKVMTGDNSETNKKHKFDEVMKSILLSYVNNRLDFYNKMEDPKIKNFIGDILYEDLKRNQISNI
jgi:type I restriction enzyme R subunit